MRIIPFVLAMLALMSCATVQSSKRIDWDSMNYNYDMADEHADPSQYNHAGR